MMKGGFDIEKLRQDAHYRWLEPSEVLYILQNHEEFGIAPVTPNQPASGSILLFNKRVHRFFRKDGYAWQKKKNGRTAEAHEHLKVGNVTALNCYYARGEKNPYFRRRCYWLLDQEFEHIVLVHYREVSEGRCIYKPDRLPATCFAEEDSSVRFNVKNSQCCTDSENVSGISGGMVGAITSTSYEVINFKKGIDGANIPEFHSPSNAGFHELGGIMNQSFQSLHQTSSAGRHHLRESSEESGFRDMPHGIDHELVDAAENCMDIPVSSSDGRYQHPWTTLKNSSTLQNINFDLGNGSVSSEDDGNILEISDRGMPIFQHKEDLNIPIAPITLEAIPSKIGSIQYDRNTDAAWKDALDSFDDWGNYALVIREISPEQAYCSKNTKVFIMGDFLNLPNDQDLVAVFGDAEVSVKVIQNGVLCCQAPQHAPGKVNLCVISGNRRSRSNVRDFEYISDAESTSEIDLSGPTTLMSSGELELLIRLAAFLLCAYSSEQLERDPESRITSQNSLEYNQWDKIIMAVSAGKESVSDSMYWVLQELVKEKLQHWLSSKWRDGEQRCSFLSNDEQSVIQMISGLGFVWALSPLLDCKVGINFRDKHGWTALHWAARFGREEMVSALLAAGALAGAVSDPTSQDPVGRSPSLIASSHGHKGLSGYLSEMALTSHLSCLKIEETDESREYAASMAERTIETVLEKSAQVLTDATDDHVSLKVSLTAVRNAAQAAARILSAFRAHSFRIGQEKAAVAFDKYGWTPVEYHDLSAVRRQQKPSHLIEDQKSHEAALHIQKTFRGRKGRRNFLTLRKNVVKIQAHVRGQQVRKKYKELLRCVNIIEKIILRWRRGRAGLRGFHLESNKMGEAEEDDILKVFRKQKVDEALDKDFKRILSMVGSTDARRQYSRMVSKHFKAKGEQCAEKNASSSVQINGSEYNNLENLHFPPFSPLPFEQSIPWGDDLIAYNSCDWFMEELWPI